MSARLPAMSVVVVTRDRPGELRACLEAVLGQEYPEPLEVLVVYDRSPVDTSIAGSRPGGTVRALPNSRTPGLAGGRNTGILAASGELVAFCDDDDVWLPGKLLRQAELLAREPGTDFASCGIRVVYGDREVERVVPGGRVEFTELLESRQAVLHPSTFCIRRSSLLDGLGLVDESLPGSYAEDYELLLRAARHGPVRVLPEVLVEVRWHPKSYFAGQWPLIAEALQQLLERYPEFEEAPRGIARLTGQVAFAEAARGERLSAIRWAVRTLRHHPGEARGFLALAVALGLLRAPYVVHRLNSVGRGI